MNKKKYKTKTSHLPVEEKKRRRREIVIIVVILVVVAALTFAENRIIYFGADFPISNTILMFILININLLLLIFLIFLVFRNVVKLLYDRKRSVMGAKLRTKLVVAFISLTLVPTIVLFYFSINFITASIEFWFNVPVEQALENSLSVGRRIYKYTEENNKFYLERISYQIKIKNLYEPKKSKALSHYIQVVQRSFNIHAVEVYSANSKRLAFSLSPELTKKRLKVVAAENFQNKIKKNNVKTISQPYHEGELIRTIGTVPFGTDLKDARAFVVLSYLISSDLSEDMASISRGFEEYQQIKLLKKPIQITYYMTLSIVALLVLFCAVWFGFYLAKSITIPIMELAEGTRRVAEGDLSFSIGVMADDEIGSLVGSFNKMTTDLKTSREQVESSAHMLRQQNIEIEEKRQYMEIVLKNVSAGVISITEGGLITTINKSAEKMLNLKSEEILNKNYKTMLENQHLNIAKNIIEHFSSSIGNAVEMPFKLSIDGRPRSFMMHINALKDNSGQNMGLVIVFDDLSDLEKAQRMAVWREVARRIAHEVKNPLTPITLSAQRLNRKYSKEINEKVFDECIRMIIEQVDVIRNLVNEFSNFARFPTANPKPCSIVPIVEETLELYREGNDRINFKIDITDNIPIMNLDRQQIKQALINLVENAIATIKNKGEIKFSLNHDPILKMVRLEVSDDGAGISDEDKTRLFEPYFSTKKSGMGLGLSIVNAIISDHNGMIRVQDNHPKGAKFVIEIPV